METEDAALWRAVVAQPHDDAPRLIYPTGSKNTVDPSGPSSSAFSAGSPRSTRMPRSDRRWSVASASSGSSIEPRRAPGSRDCSESFRSIAGSSILATST